MLSRTAADLYWMSRYLERAENLARMLEVSYSLSLMPQAGRSDGLDELAMSLLSSGTLDSYLERHKQLDAERMLHFFALDEENPASIYNCLRAARGNAHAVRGRITADMWENLNATWLEMRSIAAGGLARHGISHFCDWVKQRSHLFRGATSGTIMRNDAYCFIRLGTFVERADNTLRLLDARYEMFGEESEEVSDLSARGMLRRPPNTWRCPWWATLKSSRKTPCKATPRQLADTQIAAGVMMGDMLAFGSLVERSMEVFLVTVLGIVLVSHWDWRALAVAALLFCVIRPASVFAMPWGTLINRRQRGLMGWFGIRGIGSIYYLFYALNHGLIGTHGAVVVNLTLSVIALSIVVHGLSTQPMLAWYERRAKAPGQS